MPPTYDLNAMDLSNPKLRAQYVLRYGIKIVIAAYRAVTETARGSSSDIHQRLSAAINELIETDEEIAAAHPQFKTELKIHPSLSSSTPKERENMWKRALAYKKDIKNWNSRAPSVKEVPSGFTDPTEWRHLIIRQKLFIEKNADKTIDDMPNHYQPSIVWQAYVAMELLNDHKFNILDKDDDEPSKETTKSRLEQREDSRLNTKKCKVENDKFTPSFQSFFVQNRQQHNAEQLIVQKARELQKGQSIDLFQSSIQLLLAAKDGALDLLEADTKDIMLKQAAFSVQSALSSMQFMLDNPCEYTFPTRDNEVGKAAATPIDLTKKNGKNTTPINVTVNMTPIDLNENKLSVTSDDDEDDDVE